MRIPFNKPYLTGKELDYIKETVLREKKISGNGKFTKLCQKFFEERYDFQKCLLTTSCTDALEMAAILIDVKPGDEVIIPSYTFVSTANAFVLRGAAIKFVDSNPQNPNLDAAKIEELINPKTKAIVLVHYAGMACDMDIIMSLADKYHLFVIEDCAQAIDSYYNKRPLGSFGNLSTLSFHETKNIISGEGGMLIINDDQFIKRAEIIWEKGTNRTAYFRGEVDKYGWVDIGSSFLPSELIAAFLYAQLELLNEIQQKRLKIWNTYHQFFKSFKNDGIVRIPYSPDYATNNAHMYYLVLQNVEMRDGLIQFLKSRDILAVFHYLSLHKSKYYLSKHDGRELPWSDFYSDCLLRLPLYYELEDGDIQYIIETIREFFN
jgi:dTDP-4-amino-4,6-dideoxygalactose transaminase